MDSNQKVHILTRIVQDTQISKLYGFWFLSKNMFYKILIIFSLLYFYSLNGIKNNLAT